MDKSKNLNSFIRYPLAIIAGILSGILFLGLTVGALKVGELLIGLFSN
jgi:hypothetical protein